jgi:elongation factor 1-alpha
LQTKLKDEAKALGKDSFAFAFYMDKSKEERARGVTIACTTKEFFTDSYHYTIIDAPGHRDFIKNMISGASQADVGLLMVPADGNFITSIAKGDHKAGQVQGQTRQHARLLNLLGVKQLMVGVNKMDCDVAGYKKERYDEIKAEVTSMLVKVGWKKAFVAESVPVIPISGWIGDNLIAKSGNMSWWSGVDVKDPTGATVHVETLADGLEKLVKIPERSTSATMRMPVSGVYKIKGVGDVITGRVEQGNVKPDDQVIFLPTHTASTPCAGKIFSVEMHHKNVPSAAPGDNVGLNVKGLDKINMPRAGDVMILASDKSLKACKEFVAQVQVLDHPGQLKTGYAPVAFIRTGRSACKMTRINWKMGKETGGAKVEDHGASRSPNLSLCILASFFFGGKDLTRFFTLLFPFASMCVVVTPHRVCEGKRGTLFSSAIRCLVCRNFNIVSAGRNLTLFLVIVAILWALLCVAVRPGRSQS